jgi:hypothetical protein
VFLSWELGGGGGRKDRNVPLPIKSFVKIKITRHYYKGYSEKNFRLN